MALTPIEVEHTQFRVAFRGYAIDEVDAFLDRVQSELTRLLSEQPPGADAAGAAAPSTGSGDDGRADGRGAGQGDGQGPALRTLQLAQRTADEAVAEARAEAEQVRAAAQTEAASTLASAREEAERVLAASRTEAAGLDEQIAQRLEEALGDLDRRRQRLEASIEELRAFEREYRTRLRAHLESQLRELDGTAGADDSGVGVPAGAGGAAVGRTAVGAVRLASPVEPGAAPVAEPGPAVPTADR